MYCAFALKRAIRPQGVASTRLKYASLRSARPTTPIAHSYTTDASSEESQPVASSSSSTPSPQPPTREQLLELFKRAEDPIDLDELMASISDAPVESDDGQPVTLQDMYPLDSTIKEFKGDDSTSLGHRMLAEQRIVLEYFRKIEMELPSLKG